MPEQPSLEELLGAVEARLATIPRLNVGDLVPSAINPPQAVVGVPDIPDYTPAVQGRRPILRLTVLVLVSSGISRLGQQQLARYADPVGDESIPAVIHADRTLGGVVGDCLVASFRALGIQEVGIIGYFGGQFVLKVTT
jgi:hypothetical protein